MEEYVAKQTFDETVKRLDAEDKRQNERLKSLDEQMKDNTQLTISVKELATTMSGMQQEQAKQGERLEKLEERDGEKWREFLKILISALVGGIIGFLLKYVGII